MGTLVETAYANYLTQVVTDLTIEEFKNSLINDDSFNIEWANGSTRELTFDERYLLAEKIEEVRVAKTQKYGDVYITVVLNGFNIPKRTIVE